MLVLQEINFKITMLNMFRKDKKKKFWKLKEFQETERNSGNFRKKDKSNKLNIQEIGYIK